jgi:AraC-like DNA-binding protein
MLFIQRRPLPPLDKWIECIWLCRSEPRPRALERVLPSGGSQLILNLAEDETRVHRIAMSSKRFIERFKADVGVTPKRYCRLLRFQRVVSHAHQSAPTDWAGLALDCGYFDQAHLIHEFREFSGLTPTAYEAHRTTFQNHVTFLQSPEG